MKKIIIILTGFIFLSLSLSAQRPQGSGTAGDPYKIFSEIDLRYIDVAPSAHYILMTHLDLDYFSSTVYGSAGWLPLANFSGTLNGNNKTISGIKINRANTNYVGLFSRMTGATVSNLNLSGIDITGKEYVGTLAGYVMNSTITNIKTSGSHILRGTSYVGGLIGQMGTDCRLSSCMITGITIYGSISLGGIVGDIFAAGSRSGHIKRSYADGNFRDNNSTPYPRERGGIAGHIYGVFTIEECYASFITLGSSSYSVTATGGFVGFAEYGVVFKNCYSVNKSAIRGSEMVGGFVGLCLGNVRFENCYSSSPVSFNGVGTQNPYQIGAFVGLVDGVNAATFSNCYYDSQKATQLSTFSGLSGKTSAQLRNQSTYAGWTFGANPWIIDENETFAYFSFTRIKPGKRDDVIIIPNSAELGINLEIEIPSTLSIYPNPTTGTVNIETEQENPEILIYNSTGAMIMKTSDKTIDISAHPKGMYIININGQVEKLIKK